MYTIYKTTNLINGKSYIGFDSKWPHRKKDHIRISKNPNDRNYSYIHKSIQKYGQENFEWSILYEGEDAHHTLEIMEPLYILIYDSYLNGYNLTLGGEGGTGYKMPEERKKQISIQQKNMNQEQREHLRQIQLGKKLSNETKEKVSKSLIGNKRALGMTYSHTNEAKINISNYHKGKIVSDETRKKISENRKGKGTGLNNAMADPKNIQKILDTKKRKKIINAN